MGQCNSPQLCVRASLCSSDSVNAGFVYMAMRCLPCRRLLPLINTLVQLAELQSFLLGRRSDTEGASWPTVSVRRREAETEVESESGRGPGLWAEVTHSLR